MSRGHEQEADRNRNAQGLRAPSVKKASTKVSPGNTVGCPLPEAASVLALKYSGAHRKEDRSTRPDTVSPWPEYAPGTHTHTHSGTQRHQPPSGM